MSGAQHDPPVLQLMVMEHGYPLPQDRGGVYSLGWCPVEWWCCGWGGSSFFLSPRPCSSLNPSAACHYTGSPVICFITIPEQGQFNPKFSELRRLTEKSMCWSKERSRSSKRMGKGIRKGISPLITAVKLDYHTLCFSQTSYSFKMVVYLLKNLENLFCKCQ